MAKITVTQVENSIYRVVVEDGDASRSTHQVTVTPAHLSRYAAGAPPEQLLQASFEFLLEREPKESILPRFDLDVIERYFPNYPRQIRARLSSHR
jgi:hypothetical protein